MYSTLQLPLPESSTMIIKIVLYLLPDEIKAIIKNDLGPLQFEVLDLSRKQSLNFDTYEMNL